MPPFLLVLCLTCVGAWAADPVPEVLIVNSYHQGYRWSDDIVRGIEEVLSATGTPIRIHVEYLDSKRHPQAMRDPSLLAFMHAKYDGVPFRAIITADDNATWFILRERDRLFPGVPQIFCGVNDLQPERLLGRTDVTGVNEQADIGETLECMLRLHRDTRRLLVVTDGTETGQGVSRAVERWRPSCPPGIELRLVDRVSEAELTTLLDQAGEGTLVLYTFFFQDREGRTFDFDESARLVMAHAHVPVYTTWEFNQGFGMVGGKLTSGLCQGRAAGELAQRILKGVPASRLPVCMQSPNRWSFAYPALERFGLSQADLPAGSLVTDEPDTAYYRYRSVIWSVLLVLLVQIGIIAALAWNIRQRRRAEQALRRSEEDLATTLYSIGDAVIATDAAGRVTRLNPVAENLTGWTQAEASGRPLGEVFVVINEESRAAIETPVAQVLRGGTVVGLASHTLLLARNGGEHAIADSAAPIRDRQGAILGVVLVFRDQTAERAAARRLYDSEQRLRQHEKMGAIGQLAGGVAHDFNNQLTGILGFAELLSHKLADPDLRRSADRITQAALRSADLTRQLLAFARKGKYLTVTVHLHDVIREVVALLSHSIDKRITIRQSLEADPDTTLGDPGQLQNALLNLALNARDAMPEGGEMTFTTRVKALHGPIGDAELPAGNYLVVEVVDTGSGMDAETRRHLFEPFFTTKEPGKGTGLGLAAVYGAVQSHAGAITVASAPGRGSTFTIHLPLRRSASSESLPVVAPVRRGGANILVVDDEELVRSLLAELLRGLGYRVTTCADGAEAVAHFHEAWTGIDLVILDMVMPRMGGSETFAAMKRINPAVRVLLSSGYSLGGEAQAILDQGVRGFVSKPFRTAELARQIGDALRA